MRRSRSSSGTLLSTTSWARPSTMAVLPTPASPSRTGLFLVRRLRTWMTRSISFWRPMTGSSLPCRASSVRSRPKLSRAGVLDLPLLAAAVRRRSPPLSPVVHVVPQQVQDFLADVFQLQPEVHQDLGGHAFLLAQQAQQQVFGADVVVVEVAGLLDGVLDDLLGPRGLGQLAHGDHVGPGLDDLLDLQADLAQVDVEVLQDVGGDAGAFLDQAEEDVLGADVLVVEALGLLVGQLHHLAGPVGKAFIHSSRLRQSRPRPRGRGKRHRDDGRATSVVKSMVGVRAGARGPTPLRSTKAAFQKLHGRYGRSYRVRSKRAKSMRRVEAASSEALRTRDKAGMSFLFPNRHLRGAGGESGAAATSVH